MKRPALKAVGWPAAQGLQASYEPRPTAMMSSDLAPAVARALEAPSTPSSLQPNTIQLVMSGLAVMMGPAASWAESVSPV